MSEEKNNMITENKGDDDQDMLLASLRAKLDKALDCPEEEINWSQISLISKMIAELEEENARENGFEDTLTPEQETAEFIARFNRENGTNFAETKAELLARKENSKKRWMRAAILTVAVLGSVVTLNQVTMASANQSIFRFLGMRATQFVYKFNNLEVVNQKEFYDITGKEEIKYEILKKYEKTIYLPQNLPNELILQEVIEHTSKEILELNIKYESLDKKQYLRINIFEIEDMVGERNLFIGDSWICKETKLSSGETICYYIDEDNIKAVRFIDNYLYIIEANIEEEFFVQMLNTMEVMNGKD